MTELYDDYTLIRKMKVKDNSKVRMLTELMANNPKMWQIVGITHNALHVFHKCNFKRVNRMGINRSHFLMGGRHTFYLNMLTNPLTDYQTWWQQYEEFDKTIFATSSENKKNTFSEIIEFTNGHDMFKPSGYAWKHGQKEVDFLKKLYQEKFNTEAWVES
jgi:hypothetical protein